jgi:hypothetical protein
MVDSVPDTAIPAPVSVSDKHCTSGKQNDFASVPQWRLKGHVWGQQETTAEQAEPTTFEEYISHLEEWDRHLFASMTRGTNLTAVDIADQVTNRPFLVASDGASDPKTGSATFGWLLTDPTGNIMVQWAGPVYGNKPVSY